MKHQLLLVKMCLQAFLEGLIVVLELPLMLIIKVLLFCSQILNKLNLLAIRYELHISTVIVIHFTLKNGSHVF